MAVATEQAGLERGIGLSLSLAQPSSERDPFVQKLGYQCCSALTILTSADYIEISVCEMDGLPVPRESPGPEWTDTWSGFSSPLALPDLLNETDLGNLIPGSTWGSHRGSLRLDGSILGA